MNRSIRKRGVALALVLGAVFAGVPVMLAAESLQGVERNTKAKSANNKAYIVRMAEPPVVAFNGGGASGLKATRPGKGAKINPNSQDVARYADFLTREARCNARCRRRRGEGFTATNTRSTASRRSSAKRRC